VVLYVLLVLRIWERLVGRMVGNNVFVRVCVCVVGGADSNPRHN
jgi:hypothetical protein